MKLNLKANIRIHPQEESALKLIKKLAETNIEVAKELEKYVHLDKCVFCGSKLKVVGITPKFIIKECPRCKQKYRTYAFKYEDPREYFRRTGLGFLLGCLTYWFVDKIGGEGCE